MGQKQKNLVSLVVLVGIAAGIGLYAWYGVRAPEERETAQKEANEKLFSTSASADAGSANLEMRRITVAAKDGTTVLERREKKWWIVSPVEALADSVAVDSISSQLQTATFKSVIEEKPTPEDLERYGLKTPGFTVSAEAQSREGEKKTVSLKGGIENPFDGSIYMQRNDEPAVWSAPGGVRWTFDKSTFELRDKEVLAVDETKVKALEVTNAKGNFALVRGADPKSWKFTRPTQEGADHPTVAAMLGSLRSSRAVAFPEDSAELRKKLGLEKPQLEVTVRLDESEAPVRIRIARAKVEETERVFALREQGSHSTLAEVGDAALTGFDKTPAELRDRSVLTFPRDAVAELVFTSEESSFTVRRTQAADAGVSEEWTVTAPQQGPAKKWKISSVLWSLGAMKAAEIGEEKPKSWEALGVTPKSRTVTLKDEQGKTLAELRVGREAPEKNNLVYVRGSRDQVVFVDPARLDELPSQLSDVLEGAVAADAGTSSIATP